MSEPGDGAQPEPRHDRRQDNLAAALALVHTAAPLRRRDLTASLGLSRSAIGALVEELQRLRLIDVETSPPPAGETGRPSHVLVGHPAGPVVVAVHIASSSYRVGLVALGGTVVHAAVHPLPSPSSPERALTAIAATADQVLRASDRPCAGVGVAVPSAVSRQDERALAAMYLGWPPGVPVRELLGAALQARGQVVAVHVGNDANLAALAEHRHGAGAGARDLLFVTTGQQGVGGALVTAGALYTGSAGYALEVGHLTVDPRGRPCHCGSRGCLDVEADTRALLSTGDGRGRAGAGSRRARRGDLVAAARGVVRDAATDPQARAAVRRVADRLGTGLAGLVNLFNPDRIVLGGLCADVHGAVPDRIAAAVRERSFLDAASEVPIVPAALGEDAILLGAGELALQPLLDHPRLVAVRPARVG